MKKVFLLATAAFLVTGFAFAHEGDGKKCGKGKDGKECCKDKKDCKKDMKDCKNMKDCKDMKKDAKETQTTKPATKA